MRYVEAITGPRLNKKGERMMSALVKACPFPIVTRDALHARRDGSMLLIWGWGDVTKCSLIRNYRESGRPVVALDLGYYNRRKTHEFPVRVTVNHCHPQPWQLLDLGPERWKLAEIELRNEYDKDGHILLCGMGAKSRAQFGLIGMQWEIEQYRLLRMKYPRSKIVYRPKQAFEVMPGVQTDGSSPIEKLLEGASLVVVRHSNVAVDACIAGVPVVCYDGAAHALYASTSHPTHSQRLTFLEKLAWWQWYPSEAEQCWKFLQKVSSSTSAQETSARLGSFP